MWIRDSNPTSFLRSIIRPLSGGDSKLGQEGRLGKEAATHGVWGGGGFSLPLSRSEGAPCRLGINPKAQSPGPNALGAVRGAVRGASGVSMQTREASLPAP